MVFGNGKKLKRAFLSYKGSNGKTAPRTTDIREGIRDVERRKQLVAQEFSRSQMRSEPRKLKVLKAAGRVGGSALIQATSGLSGTRPVQVRRQKRRRANARQQIIVLQQGPSPKRKRRKQRRSGGRGGSFDAVELGF